MTARILPALLLGGFVLTFSSNISSSTKLDLKPVNYVEPSFSQQAVGKTLNDSIDHLLHIVDGVAIRTKANVEKINKNNKIIKNYEMEIDTSKLRGKNP